jgi:hypothetical protein
MLTIWLTQSTSSQNTEISFMLTAMISSFAGKCLGNDGWANLKTRTNGYLLPFIEAIEGQYDAWPSLDSWLWCVELFGT